MKNLITTSKKIIDLTNVYTLTQEELESKIDEMYYFYEDESVYYVEVVSGEYTGLITEVDIGDKAFSDSSIVEFIVNVVKYPEGKRDIIDSNIDDITKNISLHMLKIALQYAKGKMNESTET